MDQNFMKEKKILPLVISMSLPMVVSMATNSLYNIVDSYFVAKISEDAMTAISLVYPIQNLMTAIGVAIFRQVYSGARCLLQAADLCISDRKRNYPGHPAACQLQLWCRRKEKSGTDLQDDFGFERRCHGCRYGIIALHSGTDDRSFYSTEGYTADWDKGIADHLHRIYTISDFRDLLWSFGGFGKRCAFAACIVLKICCCNDTGSLYHEPHHWGRRRVCGISHNRDCGRDSCISDIQKLLYKKLSIQ